MVSVMIMAMLLALFIIMFVITMIALLLVVGTPNPDRFVSVISEWYAEG